MSIHGNPQRERGIDLSRFCEDPRSRFSMLTKTMAQEAAPHNVCVLSVGPGVIQTPINKSVWSNPDNMKDLLEKIPRTRIGQTDEVAKTRFFVTLVTHSVSDDKRRNLPICGLATKTTLMINQSNTVTAELASVWGDLRSPKSGYFVHYQESHTCLPHSPNLFPFPSLETS